MCIRRIVENSTIRVDAPPTVGQGHMARITPVDEALSQVFLLALLAKDPDKSILVYLLKLLSPPVKFTGISVLDSTISAEFHHSTSIEYISLIATSLFR